MKICNLNRDSTMYTSNVYLVTGTWNALKDTNTLIDVGRDPFIIEKIENASTGVGKCRVERVIITHNHYDHTGILRQICKLYEPRVYAFSNSLQYVDYLLKDGDVLEVGDRIFEVIHSPGHSSDSICLYCEEEGVLFAGDTPIIVRSPQYSFDYGYIRAIEKLSCKNIQSIYFGHGEPLVKGCNELIEQSLSHVYQSQDRQKSTKANYHEDRKP